MELTFESFINWINAPIVHVGGTPVTLGGLFTAMVIIFISMAVSKVVTRTISASLDRKFRLETGISYAIQRFIHYGIIVIGIIIATQTLGLNFGSLAVVFGFLSVGVGFGLQNITSNFISGLILLIERPISVGDFINVEGQIGKVLQIQMRSTMIMTLDNVTIIVPNSKLIENNVINWSVVDQRVRLHCPVGVEYGSDIAKVKETLLKVAKDHPDVLENPAPEVRFLEFGDSSLNLDLLLWTNNPRNQFLLTSDINYRIDEAFRRAQITIAFPQRDVHLKMSPGLLKLAGKKS